MSYYIRFTNDINADIERGHSIDFRDKSKLAGLCAWKIGSDYNPYDDASIIAAAENDAAMIARNSYAGYGSETEYAVVEGSYLGSGNDGVLISIDRVLAELSL
jgi:hypothetical protein